MNAALSMPYATQCLSVTFNVKDTDSTPSETGSFKTCDHLPRFIDIEDQSTSKYVTNVRDMGGR